MLTTGKYAGKLSIVGHEKQMKEGTDCKYKYTMLYKRHS